MQIDWTPIRELYIEGMFLDDGRRYWPTQKEIAAKFGIDRAYLCTKCSQQDWTRLRKAAMAEAGVGGRTGKFAISARRPLNVSPVPTGSADGPTNSQADDVNAALSAPVHTADVVRLSDRRNTVDTGQQQGQSPPSPDNSSPLNTFDTKTLQIANAILVLCANEIRWVGTQQRRDPQFRADPVGIKRLSEAAAIAQRMGRVSVGDPVEKVQEVTEIRGDLSQRELDNMAPAAVARLYMDKLGGRTSVKV